MDTEQIVVGLDIGGTNVRAALARAGQIVASVGARWPSNMAATDEVLFAADLALALIEQHGARGALCAAGVSLAALVDDAGTVVQWPNRPAWRGLAVRALLATRLALPVVVEDDANAAALAEWTFGAGQGYEHVLVIMAGTGIGAGLILNGQLFRGRHGWAGELGHMVVLPDGPDCPCGQRGCLQTVAAGRVLEGIAAARGLPGAAAISDAAARGEAWAHAALAECGRWLGLAAANVVNLLDLDAVVIGGGMSALGPPWWQALEAGLRSNTLNAAQRRVVLRRATLPDSAGLLGAVSLAAQLASESAGQLV
jgi:glucokinase